MSVREADPEHPPVVSNTTPLITLAGVDLLYLLPALYGTVWIPDAVHVEYQTGRTRHPESPDLDALTWLQIHSAPSHPDVPATLDAGEFATLSLALHASARLVLLDEARARRVSSRLGLPTAGSLTVLIEAKRLGLISQVEPIVDMMIAQGRRVSASLKATVLRLAGE